jgi:hypothetical protein
LKAAPSSLCVVKLRVQLHSQGQVLLKCYDDDDDDDEGVANKATIMAATTEPSWQGVLDNLTQKANKDGLLRSLKTVKSIEAKVAKVIDSITIR